jgi:hypothetical protein
VKPANHVENRRDRRLRQNQSGKRKVVVVIRERDGKTVPGVFASEVAALNFIRTRIARGTEVYADEASAWNELHVASRCIGSTSKKHTASKSGSTPTTPNRSSPACAAPRSDIIISLARTLLASRRRALRLSRVVRGRQRDDRHGADH